MANKVFDYLERKADISHARPERHTALRQAAESLNRTNVDAATVELFNEAVARITHIAYAQDEVGYCNIDPVTFRLLLPAPWGRAGHRKWSITRSEADILRSMLFARQAQTPNRPPGLWLYDRQRRSWRLNVFDYDTRTDGMAYWQRRPLSRQEYRQACSRRVGR